MFEFWKARDPIALYEKFLTDNKIWDAAAKAELDARIEKLLDGEQKFAEDSPMPPPEFAAEGVYCDGCHTIEASWQRPIEEVTPPKSGIDTTWKLSDFGGMGDAASIAKPSHSSHTASESAKISVTAPKHHFPKNTPPKGPVKSDLPVDDPEDEFQATEIPAEPAGPRIPFGRGPKDKAFRESPESKVYSRVQKPKTFGQNPQNKSFSKNGQNKPFHKGGPHKNHAGKPFAKGPEGKQGGR
jgi:hypothetical protein